MNSSAGFSASHGSTSARVEATNRTGRYGTADELAERASGLAQPEVERGALERPAPVVADACMAGSASRARAVDAARESSSVHVPASMLSAGKPSCSAGVYVTSSPSPCLAVAAEHDRRRHARPAARHRLLAPLST